MRVRKDGVPSSINRRRYIIIFKCTLVRYLVAGVDATAIFPDELYNVFGRLIFSSQVVNRIITLALYRLHQGTCYSVYITPEIRTRDNS